MDVELTYDSVTMVCRPHNGGKARRYNIPSECLRTIGNNAYIVVSKTHYALRRCLAAQCADLFESRNKLFSALPSTDVIERLCAAKDDAVKDFLANELLPSDKEKLVEYPRKVTSYLSIYSLFVMTILICVTCGLEMPKDKEYRG